jgi:hypothetical protein
VRTVSLQEAAADALTLSIIVGSKEGGSIVKKNLFGKKRFGVL